MTMREDMERAAHLYEWWPQEKAVVLLRQMAEALEKAGPKGRLCLKTGAKETGAPSTWLWVEDGERNHVGQAENDSWLCPPLCT